MIVHLFLPSDRFKYLSLHSYVNRNSPTKNAYGIVDSWYRNIGLNFEFQQTVTVLFCSDRHL